MYSVVVTFHNGEVEIMKRSTDLAEIREYAKDAQDWYADYGGIVTIMKEGNPTPLDMLLYYRKGL